MLKLSTDCTTHNGSTIKFCHSQFCTCGRCEANTSFSHVTLGDWVVKNFYPFNVPEFFTHFLQKSPINIIIEPV